MIRHAVGAGTLAGAAALLFLSPATRVFPQNSKLQVAPHYVAGEVVRYAIETTTVTQSRRSGTVSDPQGPSALTLKWTAVVRTEVLAAPDAAAKSAGGLRMRTTFEKSAAESSSDSYDPSADAIEAQYREMEGKSFEYAMDASGRLTDVSGLEGVSMKQGNSDAMQEFLSEMTAAGGAPKEGIAIGQSWATERPVPESPLEGTVWKGQSSYLRNEPCEPAKAPGAPNPAGAESCAVLMTKLILTSSRPAGKDATPENLKKMGMKTSGTWTGDGESLTYISLKTGRLVSVTQNSSERMDFSMSSAASDRDIHYQGTVTSKMQMSLLPAAAKQ
ncbi:MAG TPA: hypothetical protein VFO34_01430 [Candidatus Acidoferrales bacterium]|nr:hypothetical protein [Candidatus Acidoferrales bacterium]